MYVMSKIFNIFYGIFSKRSYGSPDGKIKALPTITRDVNDMILCVGRHEIPNAEIYQNSKPEHESDKRQRYCDKIK